MPLIVATPGLPWMPSGTPMASTGPASPSRMAALAAAPGASVVAVAVMPFSQSAARLATFTASDAASLALPALSAAALALSAASLAAVASPFALAAALLVDAMARFTSCTSASQALICPGVTPSPGAGRLSGRKTAS